MRYGCSFFCIDRFTAAAKIGFDAQILASQIPEISRQRGQKGKNVVFATTLIARSGFNSHPGHAVVASLDKTLYDDCALS